MLSPFPRKNRVRVVVETPRGSRHKFDLAPEHEAFRLKKTLPEGMTFPHDFGFVPQTQGQDGDPVDALVLFSEPTFPGCIVDCRLIGVIRAAQQEGRQKWVRNDRYLMIAEATESLAGIKAPRDLPPHFLEELARFFKNYNELEGRRFRVLGVDGPAAAHRLLLAACSFAETEDATRDAGRESA
jgi:inorganic pyrophosphatase